MAASSPRQSTRECLALLSDVKGTRLFIPFSTPCEIGKPTGETRSGLLPLPLGRLHPTHASHVQPFADWLIPLVRAESQNVAVQIFHLHFISPRVVRWRMSHPRAALEIFREQLLRILYTNPDPRSRISLVTHTEKNMASPARDRRKSRSLPIHFESHLANVVLNTRRQVLHSKDRTNSLETHARSISVCHRSTLHSAIRTTPHMRTVSHQALWIVMQLLRRALRYAVFVAP